MQNRNVVLVAVLAAILVVSLFVVAVPRLTVEHASDEQFFVGVEIGWRASVAECKAFIDKVKNFTNLLVIASATITCDEVALNETCDYAFDAGMYLMVYFGDSKYSPSEATVNGVRYCPMVWTMQAKETYGDHFLGAYYQDELGGKKLDSGQLIVHLTSTSVKPSTCLSTANSFVEGLSSGMKDFSYLCKQAGASLFTSDYALYWFDYKAGYDVVLAQVGWNHSTPLNVALCRGAANVQNKDWGVMVTWTYYNSPYLESGPQIYDEMVLAYDSGAKYVVIYDASDGWLDSTLTKDHFEALESFWDYVKQNPDNHGRLKADTALVLPQGYGFGFRSVDDSVWGVKEADTWKTKMYNDVCRLLDEYGCSLDIVYGDTEFIEAVTESYSEALTWTTGNEADSYPVVNLNNTMGYLSIQEAIDAFATCEGHVLFVKAGTYHENVVVDKPIGLVGEDKETTVIYGDGNNTALTVACDGVTVTGFTVRDGGNITSGTGGGICLENANNCVISDTVVTANNFGIYLQNSGNNKLKNNNIFDNKYNFGVSGTTLSEYVNDVDSSNTVNGKPICYWINKHKLALHVDIGYLALVNCTDIVVKDLRIANNANGLVLVHSQNVSITSNTFTNNYEGLKLLDSSGNVLSGNSMHDNFYNFWVSDQYDNYVDETNTVNGKPVYYWINQHDQTVPNNAAYVALINCTGITVQNLQLSKNGQGIILVNTKNTTINGNTVTKQFNGIVMDNSSNNTITQNVLEQNMNYGIVTVSCDKNSFSENIITNNEAGIIMNASTDNSVQGNSITQNGYGIKIQNSNVANSTYNKVTANNISANDYHISFEFGAQNNSIYHNNFVDNTEQLPSTHIGYFRTVIVLNSELYNFWDNGSEGNYWSDYTGTDANGDGIGDTPYNISGLNMDNYPLMQPFTGP